MIFQSADYHLTFEIFLYSIIIHSFVPYSCSGFYHPTSHISLLQLYLFSECSPSALHWADEFPHWTLLGSHLWAHVIELKLLFIIPMLQIINFTQDFLLKSLDQRLETCT